MVCIGLGAGTQSRSTGCRKLHHGLIFFVQNGSLVTVLYRAMYEKADGSIQGCLCNIMWPEPGDKIFNECFLK